MAEKPVKTKTINPFPHLDDLDSMMGATDNVPTELGKNSTAAAGAGTSALGAAAPNQTRAKTAAIRPGEQMRDYLNRINYTAMDSEIGDDEAAARVGVSDQEPQPVITQDLPAVLSKAMTTLGDQNPQWHTINNLPGYMARNVRGMGREFFKMFTTTALEKIQTIANVQGQGPNTDAELRAVAAWLVNNGTAHNQVSVNMGPAIPGYKPDVKEYTARGIRFHVVRDPMGQYIYAYPEASAVDRSMNPSLAAPQRPQLPKRESTIMKPNIITEEYKLFKTEQLMIQEWTQSLLEDIIKESTLSTLIGDSPGGQNLVSFLHNRDKLSNTAEYDSHPTSGQRIQWKMFKQSPDHFLIVSGTDGVAGIKPERTHIEKMTKAKRGYDPSGDGTLPYQIVAFKKDQRVDNLLVPDPEDPRRHKVLNKDAAPTIITARGGIPGKTDPRGDHNIFDRLSELIGSPQAVYVSTSRVSNIPKKDVKGFVQGTNPADVPAKSLDAPKLPPNQGKRLGGATDLDKTAARKAAAPSTTLRPEQAMTQVITKLRPVLKKLGFQALGIVQNRVKRYIDGENYEKAEAMSKVGKKIKEFMTAIDTSGDLRTTGGPIFDMIKSSLVDASGFPYYSEGFGEWLSDLATGTSMNYGPVLDALRNRLVSPT